MRRLPLAKALKAARQSLKAMLFKPSDGALGITMCKITKFFIHSEFCHCIFSVSAQ